MRGEVKDVEDEADDDGLDWEVERGIWTMGKPEDV